MGESDILVSHIQYVGHTFFIKDATMKNLWAMKAILKFFELTYYLKANFVKGGLIGVKVEEYFTVIPYKFLYYKTMISPFKCLSLLVDVNPCQVATWNLMLQVFKSWHYRSMNLGVELPFLTLNL